MTDATTVQPLYDTYNRAALRFERGEGIWLITEDGERYLDFAAGIAVNSLGHSHPHLVETLKPRQKSCGICRMSMKFQRRKNLGSALSKTPSPTRSSSRIPEPKLSNVQSRPRAVINM